MDLYEYGVSGLGFSAARSRITANRTVIRAKIRITEFEHIELEEYSRLLTGLSPGHQGYGWSLHSNNGNGSRRGSSDRNHIQSGEIWNRLGPLSSIN